MTCSGSSVPFLSVLVFPYTLYTNRHTSGDGSHHILGLTAGVICIRSMYNRKYTALHSVRFFSEWILTVILTHNSLKTSVEGIFVTGTLNVKN